MALKQKSITEAEVYLTPQDKVDEILELGPGYKVYYESITSNVSNLSQLEDVYVLDVTTTQPQPEVSSTQARKTDGDDLYDEEHYAIANVKNCPTERFGVLKQTSTKEPDKKMTKENKCLVTKKHLKVIGLVIAVFCFGLTTAFLVVHFTSGGTLDTHTGIISIN